MTKFSVGVKPSTTIVKALHAIDNGDISSLYGSSPSIIPLPSAREPTRLTTTTLDEFKKFIKEVHDCGWTFSYTINGKCLSSGLPQETIKAYMETIMEARVDSVTISNTYLMELVKKLFGRLLHIRVSTICETNSMRDLKYFRSLYPEFIVLSLMSNRDFAFLQAINDKSDIELMVNEVCLYECPWRADHYNIESHGGSGCFEDFPFKNCFAVQMRDSTEFLKARFIRPEDIKLYESMGFGQFKITGRTCSENKIVKMTKAYLDRYYDGNLLDLFPIVFGSITTEDKETNSVNIPNKLLNNFLPAFPSRLNKNHRCEVACGVNCDYCNRVMNFVQARRYQV